MHCICNVKFHTYNNSKHTMLSSATYYKYNLHSTITIPKIHKPINRQKIKILQDLILTQLIQLIQIIKQHHYDLISSLLGRKWQALSSAELIIYLLFVFCIQVNNRSQSMIKTLLILIQILTMVYCVSSPSQQIQPNFQGSFDSTQPFSTHSNEQQLDSQTTQQQQQEDMLQFAQHLGDYIPDQTFTIRLLPNQNFSFFLWPGATTYSIRGMFHCQISIDLHQQYDSGQYLDLTILDQHTVVRQYKKQRLGVFNHPHNLKDHKYYFHFSSHQAPIDIYFSYQKVASNKQKTNTQTNETDVYKVSQKFIKVNRLLQQQERQMMRLIQMGDRHTSRIRHHVNQLYWRGIGEGVVIIGSALLSLGMLKRQIYKQYQSLV